ncbi:GNAT family N-acetyltransferase [Neobacillus sp. 3P2-tot-E-2]|uniref:GNAT family N-acetyltransferase n=1 Tax=Neobacillus sp. 3P2-tot-E-2 TaxID=3132212 RepID=UPI0039A1B3F4
MEIIKLNKNHIENALDLVWTVFLEFEAPDYSPQGIEEFKKFISIDSMIKQFEKEEITFWGCIINNVLTGVIATRGSNHICLLFVNKDYHRQGIGKRLFHTVLEECKRNSNCNNITVNSSPYAVEVYHRLGFVNLDQEQTVNGLRFTPMSYSIFRGMSRK